MVVSMPIRVTKGSIKHRILMRLGLPLLAISDSPYIIVVDVEKMTSLEYCMAEVQKDAYILEFVPEKFKTSELCLAAVQQNRATLKFVPKNLQTPEFLAAVEASAT